MSPFGRTNRLFAPGTRDQIRIALGSLAPLAILLGYGTEAQWEQWLVIGGAVLAAIGPLVSLINVRDVSKWAVTIRAVIYGLATTVSPALVALGYYDESLNARILTGIALALTFLSNAVAIFTSRQQQAELAATNAGLALAKGGDGTYRLTRPRQGE